MKEQFFSLQLFFALNESKFKTPSLPNLEMRILHLLSSLLINIYIYINLSLNYTIFIDFSF